MVHSSFIFWLVYVRHSSVPRRIYLVAIMYMYAHASVFACTCMRINLFIRVYVVVCVLQWKLNKLGIAQSAGAVEYTDGFSAEG